MALRTSLEKIALYLDGNVDAIQSAVREHFLLQHTKAGLDENLFDISFSPKRAGIQTGFVCDIRNGTETPIRYYIKTHQYGPTESNLKSLKTPDAKEIFIYKLLQNIGLGPESHFIMPHHGSKKTIYIATKECHLILLSQVTESSANPRSLVQLDLISRILCLRDCTTNSSNCGQLADGKPMIIDFRIEKQSGGYVKSDILEKFYEGNGEFNYTSGVMAAAVHGVPQHEKLNIVKESLDEWRLVENINETEAEVNVFISKIGGKVEIERNDLQVYIGDVRKSVAILLSASI
ncbi:hypothetical protein HDV05_000864 [Chytridiales sp. JEL 0842]|nr:hypothetical protein HDV05_000864 [Chytridiales sp. JEL 0842]